VRLLEPDVIVKGGDYTEESIVGAAEVRSRGGRVIVVPLTPGQSTTGIIGKLSESK
jgi:D-beta-D-heptose 7-phosphate kinase/D-beta-D-heptose 1-phosphate adenosyltransferase